MNDHCWWFIQHVLLLPHLHGHDPTDPTPTKISPSCAVPADVVAVLQVEDGLGTCNASRNSTATWLEHAFLQNINGCLLHISKLTGLSTPRFLSLSQVNPCFMCIGVPTKFLRHIDIAPHKLLIIDYAPKLNHHIMSICFALIFQCKQSSWAILSYIRIPLKPDSLSTAICIHFPTQSLIAGWLRAG